jgi:preprotein translocase subunit Sec61beta
MADLTITVANIIPVTGYTAYDGTAGATITAGLVCYYDESAGTIKIADNDTSAATATVKGIALHAALASQPLRLIIAGSLGMGAILTAGVFYYLSDDGGICPVADLGTPERVSLIGYGSTTSNLVLTIVNTGVAL